MTNTSHKLFAGSIPEIYNTYLVPLIFEAYAENLADRLAEGSLSNVLELAAGSGVVKRAMARRLPVSVSIMATDRNQPMLDHAASLGTERLVEWRRADAMDLPFEDEMFDVVVSQFSVMFFSEKSVAFAQARRVLRPGGIFLFSVWDRIEDNEFADEVTTALESVFPGDPPRFLARTPHGYFDHAAIQRDLVSAGFLAAPHIETVAERSRAKAPHIPAIAYCQGTPLRNEIEARDKSRLGEATDAATQAIARRFGRGDVDGKIQAHIISIEA